MFQCKIFGRTAHAPLVTFRGYVLQSSLRN